MATRPDASPAPPTYEYADPRTMLAAAEGRREAVNFASEGETIAAHVYAPRGGARGPHPAVVLIGPETYVKEQAPAEYARRLADRGFLALAFDPRFRGESGGVPRDLESPLDKVADVRNAVTYLASRPDVDDARLTAVAVCQGSSEMVRAVADDARVKALATLAGHYRDREGDAQWFGGEDKLAARRARAAAARDKYRATGEVDYAPGVDRADPGAGMPGELVWGWYHRWADLGLWPNRFAVMSDAELLDFESMSASARLRVPYLMFHSEQCMLPDAARRHFDLVPAVEKRAEWWGDTLHFQYYDDPAVIDRAVGMIADWFDAHAPAGTAPPPRDPLPIRTPAERDRAAVEGVVRGLARDADLGQWGAVRAAFADAVDFDYGAPERLTPDAILERWLALLPGFDGTRHELSDVRVEVDGDRAQVTSAFHATHVLQGAPGGDTWVLAGRYEHALARTPEGWRLTALRMIPGASTGNTELARAAQARVAGRSGAAPPSSGTSRSSA